MSDGRGQPDHIAHNGGSSANPLLPYGYLDGLPPIIGPQQPSGPVYPRPAVLSRTHLLRRRVFLALFCLFRRLLASVSRDTSVRNRATSWARVWVPLASWPTACKMGVGELFVWAAIRPCIYSDWQVASTALCGVWVCQRAGLVGPGLAGPGLGVLGCISSFSSTLCGLCGSSPALAKPPWILVGLMAVLNACLRARRNSILVTWVIWQRIKSSICRPYACLSGAKQPTSKGCRIWLECEGIYNVRILWLLQYSSNSMEWWLSWPSIISSLCVPLVRLAAMVIKVLDPS